jgi:hypothetical protein
MLKGTVLLKLSLCGGRHLQACYQDMQWMVFKWHVQVVAVLSSKDTPHNTRDVLSSNTLLTYLHNYLLTPWSRVLLEKLTGSQVVKKFFTFYGT